jgi:conjugal transfer/type IV secretion protein DotA/TraY
MPASSATFTQTDLTTSGIQSAGANAVSGGDMLTQFFGSIAQSPMSSLVSFDAGSNTVLSTLFLYINTGLLLLGSMYLSYKVVSAITSTAHDGEFVGKAFHTVWVPIRVTTGVMMLAPIAGGWSAAQVIMLSIAVQGAGLGNLAWQSVVEEWTTKMQAQSVIATPGAYTNFADEARTYFKVSLCNQAKADMGFPASIATTNGFLLQSSGCGSVGVRDSRSLLASATSLAGSTLGTNGNAAGIADAGISAEAAARSSTQSMMSSMDAVAATFLTQIRINAVNAMSTNQSAAALPNVMPFLDQRDGIALTYASDTINAISSIAAGVTANPMDSIMASAAASQGFVSAGAFYSTFANSSSRLKEAINLPNLVSVSFSGGFDAANLPPYYPSMMTMLDSGEKSKDTVHVANAETANGAFTMLKSHMGFGETMITDFIKHDQNKPALLNIKDTADGVVDFAVVGITAVGVIQGMKDGAGSIPIIGGVVKAVGGAMQPWLDVLKTTGEIGLGFFLVCSIYLPLIPMIIFSGEIIGWLTTVILGCVSAPFLAFSHFDTEGEGMGQKTQYGYTFMLTSFMRPLMLIVGFVAASEMIEISVNFLTQTYSFAVAGAQINSMTGLVSIFGYCALYMVLAVGMVNTSCSIIHLLPDAIFKFMGAEASGISFGRNSGDDAKQSTVGAAMAVKTKGKDNKGGGGGNADIKNKKTSNTAEE